jgi:hypothetical protein
MPARGSGITKEDVRKAYLDVKTLKPKPTLDDIVKHLGRGSKSTVHTYMEEIRREEQLASTISDAPDNYGPLIEAAKSLIAESRNKAISGLEDRVDTLESDNRLLKIALEEVTEERNVLANQLEDIVEKKLQSDVEAEIHRKQSHVYMELNKHQYGDLMFVKGRLEQLQTDDDIHKDLKELIDSMTSIAARRPIEEDLNMGQVVTPDGSAMTPVADSESSESNSNIAGTESSKNVSEPSYGAQELIPDHHTSERTVEGDKETLDKTKAPKSRNRV